MSRPTCQDEQTEMTQPHGRACVGGLAGWNQRDPLKSEPQSRRITHTHTHPIILRKLCNQCLLCYNRPGMSPLDYQIPQKPNHKLSRATSSFPLLPLHHFLLSVSHLSSISSVSKDPLCVYIFICTHDPYEANA